MPRFAIFVGRVVVGLVVAGGCRGRLPVQPELPKPGLAFPAPPAAGAATRVVATALPASGMWQMRFEYSVSQRAPGAPDLDVQAEGSAVVRGSELASDDVHVKVRPDSPSWVSAITRAVPQLGQRIAAIAWRTVGDVDGGVLLSGDGAGVRAWAVVDEHGATVAHFVWEEDGQRGEVAQSSRLTVALERKEP